jgi:hypothetical protein
MDFRGLALKGLFAIPSYSDNSFIQKGENLQWFSGVNETVRCRWCSVGYRLRTP